MNFSSAHPNHTFSGNVYSQCLRLRRIINSNERLFTRLQEIAKSFREAGYPEKMVKSIIEKVRNSERNIGQNDRTKSDENDKMIVVSTYEADDEIVKVVKDSEEIFKRTNSFRSQRGPLFKFVK